MKMTTIDQNNLCIDRFVEISGKDTDSIGISEGDILKISRPFHYSEGAADI
jgi:hypothetical protein